MVCLWSSRRRPIAAFPGDVGLGTVPTSSPSNCATRTTGARVVESLFLHVAMRTSRPKQHDETQENHDGHADVAVILTPLDIRPGRTRGLERKGILPPVPVAWRGDAMAPRTRREGVSRRDPPLDASSLLNFQMGRPRNEARGPRTRPRKAENNLGPKVSVQRGQELFRLAQCHFLVADTAEVEHVKTDVDKMLPWEDVLRVELHSEKEWACPICLEDHMVCPHMTPCGHVYCLPCIMQDILSSRERQGGQGCPQCYAKFTEKELRPAKIVKLDKLVVGSNVEMKLMHRKKGAAVAKLKCQAEKDEKKDGMFPFTSTGECNRFSKYTLTNSADAVLRECLVSLDTSSALLEEQIASHQECANQLQYVSIAEAALRKRVDDWVTRREEMLLETETRPSRSPFGEDEGYWFYQLSDGRPVFLHSLNFRILVHQFGDPSNCPGSVMGKILQIDSVTQTEELRRRMRYFSHISLATNILMCEMDLSGVHTKESLEYFKDELQQRQKQRKRKARKEAKEARKGTEEDAGKLTLELDNMPPLSECTVSEPEEIPTWREGYAADEPVDHSGSPSWSNVTKMGFASGLCAPRVGGTSPGSAQPVWGPGTKEGSGSGSWAEGVRSGFSQPSEQDIGVERGQTGRKKGGKQMVLLSVGQRRKY